MFQLVVILYLSLLILSAYQFNLLLTNKRIFKQKKRTLNALQKDEIEKKNDPKATEAAQKSVKSKLKIIELQIQILKTYSEI